MRAEPGAPQRILRLADALRRHGQIDVGHAAHARLVEVHAPGVQPLEHQRHDAGGDERVEHRQHAPLHSFGAPPPMLQMAREQRAHVTARRHQPAFDPPPDHRTHAGGVPGHAERVGAVPAFGVERHRAVARQPGPGHPLEFARRGHPLALRKPRPERQRVARTREPLDAARGVHRLDIAGRARGRMMAHAGHRPNRQVSCTLASAWVRAAPGTKSNRATRSNATRTLADSPAASGRVARSSAARNRRSSGRRARRFTENGWNMR